MPPVRDLTSVRSGATPLQLTELTVTQDHEAQDHAIALSRPREQPPASVPGYTIIRNVGDGAYGSVWLAREQNTGKQVAIKFYTHRRGLDWSLLNREVEKLAVLYTSRNIIGLLDVGWDADPPFYVMEYLENGSLSGFLSSGPLPAHEAVRIARSVLHALVHAHGSGILHCDLKPANILLDNDFEPRLCDFGQSRLSNEQYPALGTLFYMAPEQADLTAIPDARWDVYALGALFYHMLTGGPPHRAPENEEKIRAAGTLEERLAVYRRLLETSPRPAAHRKIRGVDRALADIVDRCLRVDPQKRFPNAQAVLDALDQRDRQRSRRPLIGLGIIGPVLLMIAMAGVFRNAMSDAVHTARNTLIDRAMESDSLSAELLARSLQHEIDDRIDELQKIADDPDVRAALLEAEHSEWANRESLWKILAQRKDDVDSRRQSAHRQLDKSWLLTDAKGFQRWRGPPSPKILDANYAHRDYFHGLNLEYRADEPHEGVEPIRKPHVSLTFKSDVTRRYMTALSVPVWDADHTHVIGVLARTAHLNDLLDDYGNLIRGTVPDDVNRVIALVDRREWKLLDHPWMTTEHLEGLNDEQLAQLRLPFPVVELLSAMDSHPNDGHTIHATAVDQYYHDPIGSLDHEHYGGNWLAAFASVGATSWTAVVQERRREAIRPVDRVQASLMEHGMIALAVSCILVPLVWYFVMRGINQHQSRMSGTRGTNGTASGSALMRSGSSSS